MKLLSSFYHEITLQVSTLFETGLYERDPHIPLSRGGMFCDKAAMFVIYLLACTPSLFIRWPVALGWSGKLTNKRGNTCADCLLC